MTISCSRGDALKFLKGRVQFLKSDSLSCFELVKHVIKRNSLVESHLLAFTGTVYEQPAHQIRCDAEELLSIARPYAPAEKAKAEFLHEIGRRQERSAYS